MNFINKNKAVSYYIITYILSGILFGVTVLFSSAELSVTAETALGSVTQWAPALGAVIMLMITKEKSIKSFFKDLFKMRIAPMWILFSIVVVAVIVIFSGALKSLFSGNGFSEFGVDVPPSFLTILFIIFGALGEEIGWRGYLLPILLKKRSYISASLILGVLWAFWHIIPLSYLGIAGFLLYSVLITAVTFIMTWLYFFGNRNPMTTVICHSVMNITFAFVFPVMETGQVAILAACAAAVAAGLVFSARPFKPKKIKEK